MQLDIKHVSFLLVSPNDTKGKRRKKIHRKTDREGVGKDGRRRKDRSTENREGKYPCVGEKIVWNRS